jgi:hypothetical protein
MTAKALGGSSRASSVRSYAPPAACSPCLYYSGDFNPGDPNANALANEEDAIVNNASIYTPVTPDQQWSVTGLFENTLSQLTPTSVSWEIRTGVSEGNGGTLYASGSGAPTQTATGRSGVGYTEYTDSVAISPAVTLQAGVTYWINVTPVCTACAGRAFESNVPAAGGANHVGPADVLNLSYFNSSFFGANFTNTNNEGTFPLFSFGIAGTLATGTITVTKHLVSIPSDTAKFNLQIDGTTDATNVGDGGTTGAVTVTAGTHSVSETAGTNANLSNYSTHIACSDGSSGNGTSLSGITVNPGDNVTCTITNSAGAITVTKHLVSFPNDPAKFNLLIDGTTYAANVGNGGSTGAILLPPGAHTVSETAGTNADLSKYATTISCSNGASGNGTSLSGITVNAGQNVTCTITNSAGTLTVTKLLQSNSIDPGKWDLLIDGTDYASCVGNGGTTGPVQVVPGFHSVSEDACFAPGSYTTYVTCSDGSRISNSTELDGVYVPAGGATICTIRNVRKLYKVG